MGGRGSGSSNATNGNTGKTPRPLSGEIAGGKPDDYKQFDLNKAPFVDSDGNKLVSIKTMDGFEKLMQMTKLSKETGWISNDKGDVLAGASGDDGSVYVAYAGDKKGLTFTHNHPDEFGATFSYADVYSFGKNNYKEMRAVAKEGTYRLIGNEKSDYNGFIRQLNKDWKKVKAEANSRACLAKQQGKGAVEERKGLNYPIDKWYRQNAKKYGITYKFEKSK